MQIKLEKYNLQHNDGTDFDFVIGLNDKQYYNLSIIPHVNIE
jgi:hypothetical protein